MSVTLRLLSYVLRDVARSRWILATALFFLVATDALLRFGTGGAAALVSVGSLVLLVVPLVSILFGTVYLHHAREFTALLLAQPVTRGQLFIAQLAGIALPMALALIGAIGIPFAMHGVPPEGGTASISTVVAVAATLAIIFVALAFVVAVGFHDRVTGLAAAVGVWLLFALVHDGLVLLLIMMFADYPIERPVLMLMMANPVDLARVLLLMQFDASALMGYTGAVLERTLTSRAGLALATSTLAAWVALPGLLAWRLFRRRNL